MTLKPPKTSLRAGTLAALCVVLAGCWWLTDHQATAWAYPKDAPSVCRAEASFDTASLARDGSGTVRVDMRHDCSAQRVHIVYVVHVTGAGSLGQARAAFVGNEIVAASRALNLGSVGGRENIRVAVVTVDGRGARLSLDFTNSLSRLVGLRVHNSEPGEGCTECGMQVAWDSLREHRQKVTSGRPAEFVAHFGYIDEDEEDERSARVLRELVEDMRSDGVVFIGPDIELASTPAYWINGRNHFTLVFRNIGVNHARTRLMRLSLQLDTGGMQFAPGSDEPPATIDGDRLHWGFDWPPLTGVPLTLHGVLPPVTPVTLALRVSMRDARNHERVTTLQHQIDRVPQPPTPTPDPGNPTVAPTTARPTRTPGPTPTLAGLRAVSPLHLPVTSLGPCRNSYARLDVVFAIDTSSSIRREDLRAVASAGSRFGRVMRTAGDDVPSGARRVGIVRFDREAEIVLPLTDDTARIEEAWRVVARADTGCCTRIDAGLVTALGLLSSHGQPGNRPAIVLLTDGAINRHYFDGAIEAAYRARLQGVEVFTVGLGTLYDARLLEGIAGGPDRFITAATPDHLSGALERIAQTLRCDTG